MSNKNGIWYIGFDIAALWLSFVAAILARFASLEAFERSSGFNVFVGFGLILLVYTLILIFYRTDKVIMKRGRWAEIYDVIVRNLLMAMLLSLFFYCGKISERISRSVYMLLFALDVPCMYLGRLIYKHLIISYFRKPKRRKRLVVFSNYSNVLMVMKKLQNSMLYEHEIIAVALMGDEEQEKEGCRVMELNLICHGKNGSYMEQSTEEIEDFLKHQVVDEALLSLPDSSRQTLEYLISYIEQMGINVYVTVNTFGLKEKEKRIETFGQYHVLTYSPRVFETTDLMLKRLMDIAGGLIGMVLTVLVGILVAPAILIESPGPLIFKQKRIGRNGRRFYIYKFRSMYADAEKRKQELMDQNEMNGLMFKVKNDPRITKVGKFIRKTSIDEFPQFFNVLKGDMSLVGTRPPTEDEFLQYNEAHKRRLSLKPGITGLWQVSGRSDIQDFEDVVKLDVEYIDNWSISLDIKILFQTIWVVLFRKGAS